MFARSDITSPEVNRFGLNLGNSEYVVWSSPWQILGAIRAETRAGDFAEVLFFLSSKQRTTLPISGQPNFTKFAHKTCFCEAVNPFGIILWKCALKGSFFQKPWSSSTISDFKPRFLGNDYKSWKIMTDWRAYGMLAFHPYRWNQLKVIPLNSRLRTQCSQHMQPWRDITLLQIYSLGGSTIWTLCYCSASSKLIVTIIVTIN